MAIIFIRPIQSRLDKAIMYVGNKRKTKNESPEEFLDLHNALKYTVDDLKTEQKFFVSGINCKYENAFKRMTDAKNEFNKTGGNLGYHIIQSFAPGEGTPESIHELGKEFARRAFGDRFEVVVATHLNTNCLHNHFVLNSVSFIDGKKYYDTKDSYAWLRKISDDLCREYGLSVIENPKEQSYKQYSSYMDEKNSGLTMDAIIKRDIDECILKTVSTRAFVYEMKNRGYTFNFRRKYPTLLHPNFEKPRRFNSLGEGYSLTDIEERIMNKWQKYRVDIPEQEKLIEEYFLPLHEPTYKEVYVSFVTVVQHVKSNPDKNRYIDKYLIEEIRKLEKLIEQQNLLCDNDLETDEQVLEYKAANEKELQECDEARERFRKLLKLARSKNDEAKIAEYKDDVTFMTERMKLLRKEIKICDRILETEPQIEEKISEIRHDYSMSKNLRSRNISAREYR